MHIFLDDERQPKDVKWINLPPYNWTVIRSYEQFVSCIEKHGVPESVSFDHDLAEEHYREHAEAHGPLVIGPRRIRYEKFKVKTGYDCAKFLADYCAGRRLPLPRCFVHTLNHLGKQNIESVLYGHHF